MGPGPRSLPSWSLLQVEAFPGFFPLGTWQQSPYLSDLQGRWPELLYYLHTLGSSQCLGDPMCADISSFYLEKKERKGEREDPLCQSLCQNTQRHTQTHTHKHTPHACTCILLQMHIETPTRANTHLHICTHAHTHTPGTLLGFSKHLACGNVGSRLWSASKPASKGKQALICSVCQFP